MAETFLHGVEVIEITDGPRPIRTVRSGVIVARTPAGERTLAAVPPQDERMIAMLTNGEGEPVGMSGQIIRGGEDELSVWSA